MYKFTRYAPEDRSGKVCWLLHELGVPFEIQNISFENDRKSPENLKIHPLGCIPVLHDLSKGVSIFESGAICLYLADQHPERGLMPATLKALCFQWTMYNYATIEPCITKYWDLDDNDPELEIKKEVIDKKMFELLKPIETELKKGNFICGSQFTVADISLAQSIFWLKERPLLLSSFPKIIAYFERLKDRESAKKAELFKDL